MGIHTFVQELSSCIPPCIIYPGNLALVRTRDLELKYCSCSQGVRQATRFAASRSEETDPWFGTH